MMSIGMKPGMTAPMGNPMMQKPMKEKVSPSMMELNKMLDTIDFSKLPNLDMDKMNLAERNVQKPDISQRLSMFQTLYPGAFKGLFGSI
tara:strand:- start:224 stop:490 length:267 start_codon:yes stop_codon:yes gene_type:complete